MNKVNVTSEVKELFCEKHNITYQGRVFSFGITESCPECKKEQAQIREEREKKEAEYKEKRYKQELDSHYLNTSGLSQSLISKTAMFSNNFKAHQEHLKSLKSNLLIYGDTGLGKTMYCAELIKRNLDKRPLYVSAPYMALYTLKRNGYELINSIIERDVKLFIVDEASSLGECNQLFIECLIDTLYNNEAYMVFSGNFVDTNNFQDLLSKKAISRISHNINFLKFSGNDLRKSDK